MLHYVRLATQRVLQFGKLKSVKTFLWLIIDRVVRLITTMIVWGATARYLGADQLGKFSYVVSIVGVVASSANLGLDAIVVREVVRAKESGQRLISTAVSLRSSAALLGCLVLFPITIWVGKSDASTLLMITMLSVSTIVQSLESTEVWFQAQGRMGTLVRAKLALFLVTTALRIALIALGLPLIYFVMIVSLETILSAVLAFFLAKLSGLRLALSSISKQTAVNLLLECWPLAVGGLFVAARMRVSQISLAGTLSDRDLGMYAAAARLSEAGIFLPMALSTALVPYIVGKHLSGKSKYVEALKDYFAVSSMLGYIIVIPIFLLAEPIVEVLYGKEFLNSVYLLKVQVFSLLFLFLGVARAQHLLNEKENQLALKITVIDAFVSIPAMIAAVRMFGLSGAAWAVTLATAFSTVFSSFVFPKSRAIGWLQLNALLNPSFLITRVTRVARALI